MTNVLSVRPLRVIFINRYFHPDLSATSELLSDLAFALSERGMSVTVITSRLRYEDGKALYSPTETVRGVQIHRVWTSQLGRFLLLGRSLVTSRFLSPLAGDCGGLHVPVMSLWPRPTHLSSL